MKKGMLVIILVVIIIGVTTAYYVFKPKDNNHIQNIEDKQVVDVKENITYDELQDYIATFKCGDIINLENSNYLSSYVIPGKWKHSLIYIGTLQQMQEVYDISNIYYNKLMKRYNNGAEVLIIDANNTGVKIRELKQMANLEDVSYLKSINVDRFNESNEFINTYLNEAFKYIDTPYDYDMKTFDEQSLYCSELVYYSLLSVNIRVDKTTKVLDYEVITPSDLVDYLESLNNVTKICSLKKDDGILKNS